MKRFGLWLVAIVVVAAVGAGLWAYWNVELRWRPKTLTKNQAEITKILETAGWVSPGLKGPKLYMVSFRTCPDCVRFKQEEYPGLHKVGVDTRLIEIARADRNGVPKSTPAERATVAEMWVNRSWALSEKWDGSSRCVVPECDGASSVLTRQEEDGLWQAFFTAASARRRVFEPSFRRQPRL